MKRAINCERMKNRRLSKKELRNKELGSKRIYKFKKVDEKPENQNLKKKVKI